MIEITLEDLEKRIKGNHAKKLALAAIDIYGEENVACYDYNQGSLIIVRYGDVLLTNRDYKSHLMTDVYAGYFINNRLNPRIYSVFLRSSYTFDEVLSYFSFSHVQSSYLGNMFESDGNIATLSSTLHSTLHFTNTCEGYGDFPESLILYSDKVEHNEDLLDDLEYEVLWHNLFNFISYESIEGGPYVYMSSIQDSKLSILSGSSIYDNDRTIRELDITNLACSYFSSKENYSELYHLLKNEISVSSNQLKIKETCRIHEMLNSFFIKQHKERKLHYIELYRKDRYSSLLYDLEDTTFSRYNKKLRAYKKKGESLTFPFKGKTISVKVIGEELESKKKDEDFDYTNVCISKKLFLTILHLLNRKINEEYVRNKQKDEDTKWYSLATTSRYEEKNYSSYLTRNNAENRVSTE